MNKSILFIFFFIQTFLLAQFSERSLTSEPWQFKNVKEKNWLPAKVPGTVHLDLMNNGLIPDPYKDENEKKVQWVEEEDWEYQMNFKISDKEWENKNIDLVFDGLDTFAEIELNGKLIKKTDNMFRTWIFPVKSYLKPGNNRLQIRFKSPVHMGKELAKNIPFTMPESPRSFVRKAQYQFGWDWGPRLVTTGIWKPVKLNFWNTAQLVTVKIEQKKITKEKADVNIQLNIRSDQEGPYEVSINNQHHKIHLQKGINTVKLPFVIKNPKLWQPNGWGDPHLYTLHISLQKASLVLSEKTVTIGLRTIELVQEKDAQGKSFYFKVNGKPFYIKGSNWIPADSFLPRISQDQYRQLVKDSKEANMNMIRVWGGGIYEDDEFYKACDEGGILVWQDFMFAGSFYPADEAFLNNVKEEVKDQVNRLQNHASIALWCGNNEIDEAIINWGYQKQLKYSKEDSLQVWKDYKKVFHELIPNTLTESLSPEKNRYWPSSPSIGWGHQKSLTEGDSHYWGVWWGGQPFEVYNDKVGRFMSEYGFQGMPSLATTKTMFSRSPILSLEDGTIKAHEKHAKGWEIIDEYMKRDYNIPTDFVPYNYVSQLLQARGMQIAIEAHRRAKPYNMGTLYWQLNDCWPVVSWSSIDYLGHWKALHYQIKRSFEQQVVFIEEKEGTLYFHLINDALEPIQEARLTINVMKMNGEVVNSMNFVAKKIDADQNTRIGPVKIESLISGFSKKEIFLNVILKAQNGKEMTQNHYFFEKPKDLKLTKPDIRIKKMSSTEIEVSTNVLAKDVYLIGDAHFSDNFFDLLPKTSKKITLSKPVENIEVMSLWDTIDH